MKRLFAVLLVLTLLTCTIVLPVSAKNTDNRNNDIEIIIHDEVSEETKEKIKNFFENGEPIDDNGTTTYGITCTLLGHKLENSAVDVITHKVRATSPRCKKQTYSYSACTRCDYETSTLMSTEYIGCC